MVLQVPFGSTTRWSAAGCGLSRCPALATCIGLADRCGHRGRGSHLLTRRRRTPEPLRARQLARRARTQAMANGASRPVEGHLRSWAVILRVGFRSTAAGVILDGDLVEPPAGAAGVVVFAHGSGSSRPQPAEPHGRGKAAGGRLRNAAYGSAHRRGGADRRPDADISVRHPSFGLTAWCHSVAEGSA